MTVLHNDAVIVGAGFGGIAATRALLLAGFRDLVVLEQSSQIGGTWRDNVYPGVRCDVESWLYSFSFAPNPDWTEMYSGGAEILAYTRRTAEQVGLTDRVILDCGMTHAAWHDDDQRWHLDTIQGPRTARVLILATGPFSEPRIPDLPGRAEFTGDVIHTARWPEGLDLAGKDVVVIGTGASAVQVVPAIQPLARSLTVVQRTPAWVTPRQNDAVPPDQRAEFRRHPRRLAARRRVIYGLHELVGYILTHKRGLGLIRKRALEHLGEQVPDPDLRAALTPHYEVGCKRITPSNDFYPALMQPNTTLVPHAAVGFTPDSVITADGGHTRADTVVFATGFHVTDPDGPSHVVGADGRSMADVYDGHPRGYLGTTLAGFPNLFTMLGPNTGTGHTSVLLYQEPTADYIAAAMKYMREHGVGSIDPRQAAQDAYDRDVQERLSTTVWATGGCTSWYQDRTGRVAGAWPGSTRRFVKQLSSFDPAGYHLMAAG